MNRWSGMLGRLRRWLWISDLFEVQIWPRYQVAFWLGFLLELFRRSWEPAQSGPLSFLTFFWAALASGLALAVNSAIGFVFRHSGLKRFWSSSPRPAWVVLIAGSGLFNAGIWRAHHAFYTLGLPGAVADRILWMTVFPGFMAILFAVLYWPMRSRSNPA